jgi:hypothetical protein
LEGSSGTTHSILEKLDEQMGEVHKALETQLIRIAQMQQQIDDLRAENRPSHH